MDKVTTGKLQRIKGLVYVVEVNYQKYAKPTDCSLNFPIIIQIYTQSYSPYYFEYFSKYFRLQIISPKSVGRLKNLRDVKPSKTARGQVDEKSLLPLKKLFPLVPGKFKNPHHMNFLSYCPRYLTMNPCYHHETAYYTNVLPPFNFGFLAKFQIVIT